MWLAPDPADKCERLIEPPKTSKWRGEDRGSGAIDISARKRNERRANLEGKHSLGCPFRPLEAAAGKIIIGRFVLNGYFLCFMQCPLIAKRNTVLI